MSDDGPLKHLQKIRAQGIETTKEAIRQRITDIDELLLIERMFVEMDAVLPSITPVEQLHARTIELEGKEQQLIERMERLAQLIPQTRAQVAQMHAKLAQVAIMDPSAKAEILPALLQLMDEQSAQMQQLEVEAVQVRSDWDILKSEALQIQEDGSRIHDEFLAASQHASVRAAEHIKRIIDEIQEIANTWPHKAVVCVWYQAVEVALAQFFDSHLALTGHRIERTPGWVHYQLTRKNAPIEAAFATLELRATAMERTYLSIRADLNIRHQDTTLLTGVVVSILWTFINTLAQDQEAMAELERATSALRTVAPPELSTEYVQVAQRALGPPRPSRPKTTEEWETVFDYFDQYEPNAKNREIGEYYNLSESTVKNKRSELRKLKSVRKSTKIVP